MDDLIQGDFRDARQMRSFCHAIQGVKPSDAVCRGRKRKIGAEQDLGGDPVFLRQNKAIV